MTQFPLFLKISHSDFGENEADMAKFINKQNHLNEQETAKALRMNLIDFRKARLQGKIELYPIPIGLSLYFNHYEVKRLAEELRAKESKQR